MNVSAELCSIVNDVTAYLESFRQQAGLLQIVAERKQKADDCQMFKWNVQTAVELDA